jgi:hypothetical protein
MEVKITSIKFVFFVMQYHVCGMVLFESGCLLLQSGKDS